MNNEISIPMGRAWWKASRGNNLAEIHLFWWGNPWMSMAISLTLSESLPLTPRILQSSAQGIRAQLPALWKLSHEGSWKFPVFCMQTFHFPVFSKVHLFIWQIFTKWLLNSRHWSRYLRYISDQNRLQSQNFGSHIHHWQVFLNPETPLSRK